MTSLRMTDFFECARTHDQRVPRDYNYGVNAPVPLKRAAGEKDDDSRRQHRHAIYAAEATGLLLIAVLLLVLTIIRYWQDIPWRAR
jgi:hypothetical protein